MNKKYRIILLTMVITSPLLAVLYRDERNGSWYTYDKKTGIRKEVFPTKNISDPRYWERHYPYQRESDLTSFKTADRSYIDQTNRDMGNR